MNRPNCEVTDCNKPAMNIRSARNPMWRKRRGLGYVCSSCHNRLTAKDKGMTANEWLNSFHVYRKHRKNYCENVDGRLGFKCTTTIHNCCMLDVDHKDGNPHNNEEDNLQTLCKCCHSYKTIISADIFSPGRKADIRDTSRLQ